MSLILKISAQTLKSEKNISYLLKHYTCSRYLEIMETTKPMGLKEKTGRWIARSPRFEKLVAKSSYYFKNPDKFNQIITDIYNKATKESGNKTIADMWDKIQTLVRMLRSHFRKEYQGLSSGKVAVGIAVLLYFLLPFDVIPDVVPLGGYIDDMSVLAWFIKNSASEIQKFKNWEISKSIATVSPAY